MWYYIFLKLSIFIGNIMENILKLFRHSLSQRKFVYSNELLPFNMKSIKPTQKYPHIIVTYACILSIFVLTFLFQMNFLISYGLFSTPKLSQYALFSAFTYDAIQWVSIDLDSSRFITYAPFFILDKSFLE